MRDAPNPGLSNVTRTETPACSSVPTPPLCCTPKTPAWSHKDSWKRQEEEEAATNNSGKTKKRRRIQHKQRVDSGWF